MSRKTIIIICASIIAAAAIVFAAAKFVFRSAASPDIFSPDETAAAETLPAADENTISADEAGQTSGSDDTTAVSAAGQTAASSPEGIISGGVVTQGGGDDEEVSLEIYVPTNVTFESTRADGSVSYLAYLAMSAKEKEEYYDSFEDPRDFYTWFNAAYDEYLKDLDPVQIGPSNNEIH